jgi:alpha-tubulin suppressor-like RCC1 family protein
MTLRIQQISCGDRYSLVLLSDGSVWASGDNSTGCLGDGTQCDKNEWACVIPAGSGVIQVSAGFFHSLALKSDGSVWATGANRNGQLGDGTRISQKEWKCTMPPASDVIQVSSGGFHSLALKSNGSVWMCGSNITGQAGDGSTTSNITSWCSVAPFKANSVNAGTYHSLISVDGAIWASGQNNDGQLGDGTTIDKSIWVLSPAMSNGVTQIVSSSHHSLALKSDGSVWATGTNKYGQLGNGTYRDKSAWGTVISSGVTHLATGPEHSMAIKSDGSVWGAGNNIAGQLGNGTNTRDTKKWERVVSSGGAQLSTGSQHSLLLKSDGSLWKTGNNDAGQLGNNGPSSLVWIPDRFFEQMLLESLLIDPPRSRRRLNFPAPLPAELNFPAPLPAELNFPAPLPAELNFPAPLPRKPNESKFEPDVMKDSADDWQGLSL